MSTRIVSFIWRYQSQFRLEAHNAARRLFNLCDPLLQPVVFLVGVPAEASGVASNPSSPNADYAVSIEPEVNLLYRDKTLGADHLHGVVEDAKSIASAQLNSKGIAAAASWGSASQGAAGVLLNVPSGPGGPADRIWRESLADAVAKCLDRAVCQHDTTHFAAPAVRVGEHDVIVVLRMCQSACKAHYTLRTLAGAQASRSRGSAASLLSATIAAFLRDQAQRLMQPEPGKSAVVGAGQEAESAGGRPAEELLREAGRALALTAGQSGSVEPSAVFLTSGRGGQSSPVVVQAGSSDAAKNMSATAGAWALFDACNAISAMRYEGGEAVGRMLICRPTHPALDIKLALRTPVGLADHRTVRKLLEVSRHDAKLISDATRVTGLGHVPRYDGSTEDVFEVRFAKHYCWDLYHNETHMMRVAYGCPQLPRSDDVAARFREIVGRQFPGQPTLSTDRLWRLLDAVRQTGHGSTIVIVQNAESEAGRLAGQALGIDPVDGSFGLVQMISAVDGAIMMDPSGRVYAFGVILDGVASPEGDRARGSRYNSAVRYQQSCTSRCVVVVISDDGMLDVLPKLRPQIGHWEPETWVRKLETLASGAMPEFSIYGAVMEWLVEHAFYLTEIQCQRVNIAKASVVAKFKRQAAKSGLGENGGMNVMPQYEDFAPDPRLDETFFVD